MPPESHETNCKILQFPNKIEAYYAHLPDSLGELFELFQQLESDMDTCTEIQNETEAEKIVNHLIIVQGRVLAHALAITAKTTEDVYFKLALWAWASPEVTAPLDNLKDYEAIAFSALRDIAKMAGKDDLVSNIDKAGAN